MSDAKALEKTTIDTIRTLAMDAVQAANSGHPGTPMALAPVIYTIWSRFLRHDPARPELPDRDRFVLSLGHASMLLYGTLHLSGYDLPLDQIRNFRQLGSACAGHPEYRHCPGVETTTGPLGAGLGNSVGMAIAQRRLAAAFNRPGHELFRHRVVALCGDGDMMEGVAMEAASLAGHLGLSNLVWVYDDNRITIEGDTSLAFSEDVGARMKAMGWEVSWVPDANDVEALAAALAASGATGGRPHLVIVRSHIAYGAPNLQDQADAHGAPLGEEEVKLAKAAYGWDPEARFLVPEEAKAAFSGRCRERGAALAADWDQRLAAYRAAFPEEAALLDRHLAGELPEGWDADLPVFEPSPKGMAGRAASGKVINAVAGRIPWMMGGSADLGPSNKTSIAGGGSFEAGRPAGRNLHFGVREHAMGAIANGMALSGLRAYTGTFFVFSDYMRPAHRLAGLMKLPVIWVFTHDSIGVGEDGPTHQPIEHLAALRAVPGIDVVRPGDANEVVEAWRCALASKDRPTAIVLSRQDHPTFDRDRMGAAAGLARGAYVLCPSRKEIPDVILIGTGTELQLAVRAAEELAADGVDARVVSMPCQEAFLRQDPVYRESVLPEDCRARVAVEAGTSFGWERFVGRRGAIVAHDDFGASAPGKVLFEHFGFTVAAVVAAAREQLGRA
ncbi:MAG: transketolase [Planctomycetes bacterium]|nr:transketolase [Planctomycetota bacterium]